MDTLQIAYKILHSLETGKRAGYMGKLISPQALGIEDDKWLDVMQSLLDEGYIAGVKIRKDIRGNSIVNITSIRITLKGAEYLQENGVMRKIGRIATDVIQVIKP